MCHAPPVRLVVLDHLAAVGARVVVTRRERRDVDAARRHEGLGLRGEPLRAIESGAHVERVDADRVARRVDLARLLIEQHEREVAVELGRHVDADLIVQVHNHLAVGLGAKGGLILERLAQCLVVVDLAVHREAALTVVRVERLVARERVDDCKPLVCKRRAQRALFIMLLDDVDARAVGATVTHQTLQRERLQPQCVRRLSGVDDREDAAHGD